jgi:hypothetical protein
VSHQIAIAFIDKKLVRDEDSLRSSLRLHRLDRSDAAM